ncbi:uncharacterized protein LOC126322527 [Schistocerca gregaria]|uniref:uncharacterized protein LOC126322527 n=1 Tax=Schistocerca gregaria TaxID=7010 RepID=UPI00211E73DB|nr:uncharacterized protein LOC126322527 [Schistocerca gregaria]
MDTAYQWQTNTIRTATDVNTGKPVPSDTSEDKESCPDCSVGQFKCYKGTPNDREGHYYRRQPLSETSEVVRMHYNSRKNNTRKLRQSSPIIALRSFNNWVKTVLIHIVLEMYSARGKIVQYVLDLAGGKGGDLGKWNKAFIRHLVLIDVASSSVEHALERYNDMNEPSFSAEFVVSDCGKPGLASYLSKLPFFFDVVSCQFALHYFFESEERTKTFMNHVSSKLSPGGFFFCTFPDARVIEERMKSGRNRFGNEIYEVFFDDENVQFKKFGTKYTFKLKDAVDCIPEYVVDLETLKELAADRDMDLVYEANFQEFFESNKCTELGEPLLFRMNVSPDIRYVDPISWEMATFYCTAIFQKRSDCEIFQPGVRKISKDEIVIIED